MTPKNLSSQLKQELILEDVISLNEELGRGSYGKVFTVKHLGLLCAAKEVHSILIEGVSLEEKKAIKDSFIQECYHCNLIYHPNIVQFMGVYYTKQSGLPIMVMQLMFTSLTSFVEKQELKIIKNTKLSILHDVSLGLSYLHGCHPAIIHRDLSSNNVLLTSHLVAKISDLGTANIIRADSKQTKSKLTSNLAPGTLHFMPPEALVEDNPVYSTPVDVFSFGGITLHVFNKEWPKLTSQVMRDPKTKILIAVSEVQRCQHYLDKITGGAAPVRRIAVKCLNDDPNGRPSITEVSEKIKSLMVCEYSYICIAIATFSELVFCFM